MANYLREMPNSKRAVYYLTKAVIAVLITLILLTGCATGPTEPEQQASIVIDDTAIDAPVVLAEQAYISKNRLYVQFRHRSDTLNSYAILPMQGTPLSVTTASPTLQQVVEQLNNLPLAQLSYLSPQQWVEHTYDLQALPVAGVALWREFRDRLLAGITPRNHGRGIVVEFLKQENSVELTEPLLEEWSDFLLGTITDQL